MNKLRKIELDFSIQVLEMIQTIKENIMYNRTYE